jgi:hypothetical protein
MAKSSSNIVHQYFKKENEEGKTLLKINPIHRTGIEIVVPAKGEVESEEIEVPADFEAGLLKEGYAACSPLEFNLYWAGLV